MVLLRDAAKALGPRSSESERQNDTTIGCSLIRKHVLLEVEMELPQSDVDPITELRHHLSP